jgi:hypothetical protein
MDVMIWKSNISEFDDLDFIIVCEGDCIIEVPIEEFVSKVYEACKIINNEDISYFSFGDTIRYGMASIRCC